MSHRRRFRRQQLAKTTACPDCASIVRVRPGSGPVTARVEVHHDDTCPIWRARGARPFHQVRMVPREAR